MTQMMQDAAQKQRRYKSKARSQITGREAEAEALAQGRCNLEPNRSLVGKPPRMLNPLVLGVQNYPVE